MPLTSTRRSVLSGSCSPRGARLIDALRESSVSPCPRFHGADVAPARDQFFESTYSPVTVMAKIWSSAYLKLACASSVIVSARLTVKDLSISRSTSSQSGLSTLSRRHSTLSVILRCAVSALRENRPVPLATRESPAPLSPSTMLLSATSTLSSDPPTASAVKVPLPSLVPVTAWVMRRVLSAGAALSLLRKSSLVPSLGMDHPPGRGRNSGPFTVCPKRSTKGCMSTVPSSRPH